MRFESALHPVVAWPIAAVIGWAAVTGVVLWAPLALAVLGVAALLLWRTGDRAAGRARTATPAPARGRVRGLVAHSA